MLLVGLAVAFTVGRPRVALSAPSIISRSLEVYAGVDGGSSQHFLHDTGRNSVHGDAAGAGALGDAHVSADFGVNDPDHVESIHCSAAAGASAVNDGVGSATSTETRVQFEIPAGTFQFAFTANGTNSGCGANVCGEARVTVDGPGGRIIDQSINGPSSLQGSLPSGTYFLVFNARAQGGNPALTQSASDPGSQVDASETLFGNANANADVTFAISQVLDADRGPEPSAYRLFANAPNPFGNLTTIAYDVPERAVVDVRVFDLSGRQVRVIENSVIRDPGRHHVTWNGRGDAGRQVPPGVYLLQLSAPGHRFMRRMLLTR